MQFAEALPPQCPPNDAEDIPLVAVYRLVQTQQPSPKDFLSHAALGRPHGHGMSACAWASCSLVLDALVQIKRWPRMRDEYHFAVKLSVPKGAGLSKGKKDSNHINFWPFASFDPISVIKEVITLPEVQDHGQG